MYLTRSGSRWMFQQRVPLDLVAVLGSNPIRLLLDTAKAVEARRQATLLAAVTNREFGRWRRSGGKMADGSGGGDDDPRDAIIKVLEATLAEAQGLIVAKNRLLELSEERRGRDIHDAEVRVMTEWSAASQADSQMLQAALGKFKAIQPDLTDALKELRTLKKEAGASDAVLEKINNLSAQLASMQGGIETVVERSAPKILPLLSTGMKDYIDIKAPELKPREGKDSKYVKYTIPNAVDTFIKFAGDKPANQYLPSDLEKFTQALARLPSNWSKLKMFKDLAVKEAGDRNARLRQPNPTLSAASIVRGYITPLTGTVDWICRQHDVRSPFVDVKAKAPKTAKAEQDRDPLSLPQLNALMAEASHRSNPAERWLPLLGFLTGARVADLVNLQGRNVQRVTEHWTPAELAMLDEEDRPTEDGWLFDVTGDVIIDGRHIRRDAKNNVSRRLIAVHSILDELGFVAWARQRKGFIFDELHRQAQDPAAAASKRMSRLFKSAGVKVNGSGQDVFHCLRHNAKDWLRDGGILERTINRHVGHASKQVGDRYGSKPLRPKEICILSVVPLPKGLDLSGYRRQRVVK